MVTIKKISIDYSTGECSAILIINWKEIEYVKWEHIDLTKKFDKMIEQYKLAQQEEEVL